MQVIVEISLYPFTKDYDTLILDFVRKLRGYEGVKVTLGETSTVVRGEYDVVFAMLESECKAALDGNEKTAVVIKILNTV